MFDWLNLHTELIHSLDEYQRNLINPMFFYRGSDKRRDVYLMRLKRQNTALKTSGRLASNVKLCPGLVVEFMKLFTHQHSAGDYPTSRG